MVHIGGLQKVSMIDYPGKLSAVIFLNGCNFHCPYCHNPELAAGAAAERIAEEDVLSYLEARRDFLEGIVVSGGEPTLQPDLPDFCRTLKTCGYAVKLDTNGSFPEMLQTLIQDQLIDFIAMDVKTDPHCYAPAFCALDPAAAIKASIALIMNSGLPYEFRTTCFRPLISARTMERIASSIKGAKAYAIQKFYAKDTLDPDAGSTRDHFFDDNELWHLKAIAEPMIEYCFVR